MRSFNNQPLKPSSKPPKHVIDDISFSKGYIVCVCAWKGRIDDYQQHRKEMEPSKD